MQVIIATGVQVRCDKVKHVARGKYLDKSKVLQYFCNVKHNSEVFDTFTEFVKIINYVEL